MHVRVYRPRVLYHILCAYCSCSRDRTTELRARPLVVNEASVYAYKHSLALYPGTVQTTVYNDHDLREQLVSSLSFIHVCKRNRAATPYFV